MSAPFIFLVVKFLKVQGFDAYPVRSKKNCCRYSVISAIIILRHIIYVLSYCR